LGAIRLQVLEVQAPLGLAERIGIGFELPEAEAVEVVPTVPSSQETEVVVNT
jgi:hypothetical protein